MREVGGCNAFNLGGGGVSVFFGGWMSKFGLMNSSEKLVKWLLFDID